MNNEDIPSAVREGKPGSSMYPESSLGEVIDGIATGREVDWEPSGLPKKRCFRNNHPRCCCGARDEVIHSFGGNVLCYGRSMMKPFMLKAFTEELNDATWEQKPFQLHPTTGYGQLAAQSLLSEEEWPLMLTP